MDEPIKLDIGCGKNKQPGHIGIDAIKFDGVDIQMNVVNQLIPPVYDDYGVVSRPGEYVRWPFEDNSVDHVHSSHFVEHLTREQWVPFFNEVHRVLKVGGTASIITPHWSHACAYGDPTHKSFLSEWVANYLNKYWRDNNAPHTGYTCDFDFTTACTFDDWLGPRNGDTRMFAVQRYTNSMRDLIINLTKRAP